MEGDAVEETDEQERPVGAAFGEFDVGAVVDGEEDVRGVGEVWEGVFEGGGVGGLHEHEGHGGAEEDDVGVGVLGEGFALEVSVEKVGGEISMCGGGELGGFRPIARCWDGGWAATYSSQKAMLCSAHVSKQR